MTYVIPIELIFKIMEYLEPKTLLVFGLVSREFRYEIKKRYRIYFDRFRKLYPYIFRQNQFNEIIFRNNCFLAYLEDNSIEYPRMNFIDEIPNKKYYDNMRKMVILRKMGLSTYEAKSIIQLYPNINRAIYLLENGFSGAYIKMGMDLDESQVENLILLKKAKFMDHYSFEIVKFFKDMRKIIYLKEQGFWDSYCMEICMKFKSFRDLIILKNQGFDDVHCIKISSQLKDFKNIINLKRHGFKDTYCLEAAIYFKDITDLCLLKNMGFNDYYCLEYPKYLSKEEIQRLINLKLIGYNDKECGDILKVEMI